MKHLSQDKYYSKQANIISLTRERTLARGNNGGEEAEMDTATWTRKTRSCWRKKKKKKKRKRKEGLRDERRGDAETFQPIEKCDRADTNAARIIERRIIQ